MNQKQEKPVFVTMGDASFFYIIYHSVCQVEKLYPGAIFYVYDWGFSSDQVMQLGKKKDVIIVPWQDQVDYNNGWKTLKTNFSQYVKSRILHRKDIIVRLKHEYLLSRKPYCFLDCASRVEKNIIFLDGDAFLVNKIDELFFQQFDIGVTIRPENEIKTIEKDGACQILNSGVIFFFADSDKIQCFIKKWILLMEKSTLALREQTTLTQLIQKADKDIFTKKEGLLSCTDKNLRIKVLPCEMYNYNWIERGFNPEINKILHFKGGRHTPEQFNLFCTKWKI